MNIYLVNFNFLFSSIAPIITIILIRRTTKNSLVKGLFNFSPKMVVVIILNKHPDIPPSK